MKSKTLPLYFQIAQLYEKQNRDKDAIKALKKYVQLEKNVQKKQEAIRKIKVLEHK